MQTDKDIAIESTMSLFQLPLIALEVLSLISLSLQTKEEIAVGSTLLTYSPSIPLEMLY